MDAHEVVTESGSVAQFVGRDSVRLMSQGGRVLSGLLAQVAGTAGGGTQKGLASRSDADPVGATSAHSGQLEAGHLAVVDAEPVMEVQTDLTGGYRVQYTDEAHRQMEDLDAELCSRVDGAVQSVAAISPRNRSSQVGGLLDLRMVKTEGMLVTFWVSEPLPLERVLTVVDVRHEVETLEVEGEGVGSPVPVRLPTRTTSLAHVHFIDDPEEAGRTLHPPLTSVASIAS